MNDHIMAHLAESGPGLHPKHYRTGVGDFRFANNEDFHFPMWLPKHRDRRAAAYAAHFKEMDNNHQSPYVNGRAEWTDDQINLFIAHLQEKAPKLWARYCELYNNIGFIDPPTILNLRKQVSTVFPVPEDIDYSNSMGIGLFDEANRRYGFEMAKPENKKKQPDLWTQCRKAWQAHRIPFDEWYRTILNERHCVRKWRITPSSLGREDRA
jgi:hypothetical protein